MWDAEYKLNILYRSHYDSLHVDLKKKVFEQLATDKIHSDKNRTYKELMKVSRVDKESKDLIRQEVSPVLHP